MFGRMLQILLGAVVFILSAPSGMAKEAIREGARAEIFVSADEAQEPGRQLSAALPSGEVLPCGESGTVLSTSTLPSDESGLSVVGEPDRQDVWGQMDFALLPCAEGEVESEETVEEEREGKRLKRRASSKAKRQVRVQKRQPSPRFFVNKCRFSICLSAKLMSRGAAKHPLTQDAGQERTAAVRFLQLEALPKI